MFERKVPDHLVFQRTNCQLVASHHCSTHSFPLVIVVERHAG